MSKVIFLKRIFMNKAFWLSILTALILLCSSIIYTDLHSGKTFMFIEFFFDSSLKELINYDISLEQIVLQCDTGYLWMFCPIIVGIPCILNKRNERFVMFRMGKNKYIFLKYLSNLVVSGIVVTVAYFIYAILAMLLFNTSMWNVLLLKKLLSVFCWGIYCVLPAIVLSEFSKNKYLILCIPFVINYFMFMFVGKFLPTNIYECVNPGKFQILFLCENNTIINCLVYLFTLLMLCGVIKKILIERRCDCGV